MLTTDWRSNFGAHFTTPVFAVGDVHGQAQALRRLLEHLSGLVEPGENAELIQLGDLIDRGPDSLGSVALAFAETPGFARRTLLPCNHELMLLQALRGDRKGFNLWRANGGNTALEEIDVAPGTTFEEQLRLLRAYLPDGWEKTYTTGPTHLIRNRVLFVHAGLMPNVPVGEFMFQPRLGPWSYELRLISSG